MRNYFFAILCGLLLLQTACKEKTVTTEHGHRLINHTSGSGPKVQVGEMVKFHVNTYLNDSMVESSRKRGQPIEVVVPEKDRFKDRFPSVLDALFMMTKGDSVTLFETVDSVMARGIPKELGDVKEIRYEITLVEQMSKADAEAKMKEEQAKAEAQAATVTARLPEVEGKVKGWLADYKAKKFGDKLKKTASGLEYVIVEAGTGAPLKKGETVETQYYGCLMSDGKMFDSSFERGAAAPFTIGQMIPGFDEGLLLLNRGSKAIFFIPWKLGYGEEGTKGGPIGPKADLAFYVEI